MRAEAAQDRVLRCVRCGEPFAPGAPCVEGSTCVRPAHEPRPPSAGELAAELELHAEDLEGSAKTVRRLARELRREPDAGKLAEAQRWLR